MLAGTVSWTSYDGGYVRSVPAGGGAVTDVVSGQGGPRGLALDGEGIAWTTLYDDGIHYLATGGIETTIASDQAGPTSIAMDADNVYWPNDSDGTVMKLARQ